MRLEAWCNKTMLACWYVNSLEEAKKIMTSENERNHRITGWILSSGDREDKFLGNSRPSSWSM